MQLNQLENSPARNTTNVRFIHAHAQDGRISTEEFKQAVKNTCMGKKYSEFPQVNVHVPRKP